MAAWSELGGGAKAAVVLAGVAVIGIGGLWLLRPGQAPVTEPVTEGAPVANLAAPVAEPAAAPEPAPEVVAEPAPQPEPEAEPAALPEAPSVGTWRVSPDGAAVVAGRAPAGSVVVIAVDGAEAAQAPAGAGGDFAALFTLAPNPAPSLMTLEARLADGSVLAFAQSIALAPIPGPDPAPEDQLADAGAAGVLITDAGVEVLPAPEVIAEVPPPLPDPLAEPLADPAKIAEAPSPEAPIPEAPVAEAAVTMVEVTVDAISYDLAGRVILSGRGAPGHVVRAYLDNALAIEGPTGANGRWNLTLPDGAPGIYTLRVDLLAADGKVGARYETPFKRETPEALAALAAPAPEPAAPEAAAPEAVAPEAVAPEAVASEPAAPASAPAEPVTPPAQTAAEVAPAASPPPAVVAAAPPAPEAPAAAAVPVTPVPAEAPAEAPVAAPAAPGTPAQPAPELAPAAAPQMVSITVQPGYSLWKIARDTYGEGVLYVQVYEANRERIRDPDLIYPGQVFLLPAQ